MYPQPKQNRLLAGSPSAPAAAAPSPFSLPFFFAAAATAPRRPEPVGGRPGAGARRPGAPRRPRTPRMPPRDGCLHPRPATAAPGPPRSRSPPGCGRIGIGSAAFCPA